MSKKSTAPKRVINRTIRLLVDVNGSTADIVIRAAGDPVTIIRTILQGMISSEAVGATARTMFVEFWREDASSGSALPTQATSGLITYADNPNLMWVGILAVMRETTSEGGHSVVSLDMKGMRKLARGQQFIIRFAGDASLALNAVITNFYKEA